MRDELKKRLIVAGILLALIVGLVVFLNSRFFEIREINISGNNRVSDTELCELYDLREGDNMISYMLKHLGDKELLDVRLKTVDIYLIWPHEIRCEVTEDEVIGYIYFQGTYLCVDQEGLVIDSERQEDLKPEIPQISGVEVGSFSLGKEPVSTHPARFRLVVNIINIAKKYGLFDEIRSVNIRDEKNIFLLTDKLIVQLGDEMDIDYKLSVMSAFMQQYPKKEGILHLEYPEEQIYLEPFTAES